MNGKRIVVASPHGFCAGVRHAIEIMETVLRQYPPPVYCLKELVHNRQVVDALTQKGVRFVKEIGQVEVGATVLFSAHGVSPEVRNAARGRGLRIVDATCPFVNKVHQEVRRYARAGYSILLIGHKNHDEVIGVYGEAPEHILIVETCEEAERVCVRDEQRVAVVTQTTLSVEETAAIMTVLRRRFPGLQTPARGDICFATENRQAAVRGLAGKVDVMLVLGSENSSNTQRLVEVARAVGLRAHLVSTEAIIPELVFSDVNVIGLTAGASTPEDFVNRVLEGLKVRGFVEVERPGCEEETIHFPLPKELIKGAADGGSRHDA